MYIEVTVKTGSKQGPLVTSNPAGQLLVFVREQPVDGKANLAVIKLLADYYHVTKSSISIVRGRTSRIKLFLVDTI